MIDAQGNQIAPGDEVNVPCRVQELQDSNIVILHTLHTIEAYPAGTRITLMASQVEKPLPDGVSTMEVGPMATNPATQIPAKSASTQSSGIKPPSKKA